MKSFVRCLLLVITITLLNETSITAQKKDLTSTQILSFLNLHLNNKLQEIPVNHEHRYGFKNRKEFKKAHTINPLQIHIIRDTLLVKQALWQVPIIVRNQYKALITVQEYHSQLIINNLGASLLARDIQKLIKLHTKDEVFGLLRIYNLNCDFLVARRSSDTLFLPLTTAKYVLNEYTNAVNASYTLQEVIDLINQ